MTGKLIHGIGPWGVVDLMFSVVYGGISLRIETQGNALRERLRLVLKIALQNGAMRRSFWVDFFGWWFCVFLLGVL
jgi:hypothetical protein